MKAINEAVEKYSSLILETERYIWQNPETGYKEFKTTGYLIEKFRELGYEPKVADGITGFYTVIDTGREGPEVLVLGELDSVICRAHPESDPVTGAVHACGHNAQCAALVGIAAALREEKILSRLSGRIRLCAVPAEEMLEIDYRKGLRREGKIKYLGGKSEFLRRGYFDGVDMAFMVHSDDTIMINGGSVGFLVKEITYKGHAAHAGASPHEGNNALYAANCGLNAVNALRETFREADRVRVHPIITPGGDVVNTIPGKVTLESYVRGGSLDAIARENKKVNRALIGAALSLGTNIDINDIPGYAPLHNDRAMMELAYEAAKEVFPDEAIEYLPEYIGTGSTDMGDLSLVMPVVHPYCGGTRGVGHGADFEVHDPIAACVGSAKWQIAMLTLLLSDGAVRARKILDEFTPQFKTKEEFLAYQDALNSSGERISYEGDFAKIKL